MSYSTSWAGRTSRGISRHSPAAADDRVGLVAGRSATLDLGLLLSKRLSLRGTVLRSRSLAEKVDAARAFARDVLPLLESGRVRPIVDEVLPAWEAKRAHRRLETNETYGKLVLTW